MPEGCILFSQEILHRDFFRCNPSNTGHHEYPKFELLAYDEGCHGREVRRFVEKINGTPNDDYYVVFYTRHTPLPFPSENNKSINKIVGYFKIEKEGIERYKSIKHIYSSESILLPKTLSIKTSYIGRGVPVSWGNSSVKSFVNTHLPKLINLSSKSISKKYQKETEKIMAFLKDRSGREKLINICDNQCKCKMACFWGRKRSKTIILEELYKDYLIC
jgi:hypothetical protein